MSEDGLALKSVSTVSVDVLALIADSVICTDEYGRILLTNRAAEESFGYSASEMIGQQIEMLLPPRYRVQHAAHMRNFALGKGAANRIMGEQREVCGQRKNGEEFPAEATISRHSVDGRTILAVVHRDITYRKELEDQREAIVHEMNHRIKNVLAVVGSLVSLSAKSATSVDEFAASLQGRLQALAATQTFLSRGARESISLSDLLLTELNHYRNPEGTNVVIEGEPVALCPTAIQPLALAVHELATNSAKYGALSDPHGHVNIFAKGLADKDESMLMIEWIESGGPPVKTPTRRGFGTTFIEKVIKRTFHADIKVDYRPEGLAFRMILPRAAVENASGTQGQQLSRNGHSATEEARAIPLI